MGVLTDIVIADGAEAVLRASVPSEAFPGIDAKGVDVVKLDLLRAILSESVWDAASVRDFAVLAQEDEREGPWVFAVPADLVEALADLHGHERKRAAESWAEIEEFKLDGWKRSEVRMLLDALCGLAERARNEGKQLLMWVCL
jgi:hypothetical protein